MSHPHPLNPPTTHVQTPVFVGFFFARAVVATVGSIWLNKGFFFWFRKEGGGFSEGALVKLHLGPGGGVGGGGGGWRWLWMKCGGG